jgi:hypothetical protein
LASAAWERQSSGLDGPKVDLPFPFQDTLEVPIVNVPDTALNAKVGLGEMVV